MAARPRLHKGKWYKIKGILQEMYGIDPENNEKVQEKILEILEQHETR